MLPLVIFADLFPSTISVLLFLLYRYQSTSGADLDAHMITAHPKQVVKKPCSKCPYVASSPAGLAAHMASTHPTCTFPGCGYVAKDAADLKVHTSAAHKPTCKFPGCGYKASSSLDMIAHMAGKVLTF